MIERVAEAGHATFARVHPPTRAGREDFVAGVLSIARHQLGMEVGYFSEFAGADQVVRGAEGDAASFGLEPGARVPLADSYCQRVVDGTIASLVPDVLAEPLLADLPVTRAADMGAYVGVPLELPDGRLYGTLCCASHGARHHLGERDVRFMRVLAGLLAEHLHHEAERAAWTARLERANAELAEFAHVVAHDLTEPMRTVSGLVQLLDRRHGAALGDELGLVVAEAQRMEALVDDLLRLARAGGETEAAPVDLAVLADDVLAALRGAVDAAGATVLVGPLPVVHGAPAQLHQLLQNLVANALKFTRDDRAPVVTVRADRTPADDGWEVSVTDEGPGVDPADRERIFGAFKRGRTSRDRPGAGIGLAVCAKVAAAHGGRVGVHDAPGGGARFAVTLLDEFVRDPSLRGAH